MESRLLIVYNTCGISGKDNVNYYINALRSILIQLLPQDLLILSGCCLSSKTKQEIKNFVIREAGISLFSVYIDEIHPVNVTFNKAVSVAIEKFGTFDGYMYVDSGSMFKQGNVLSTLKNRLRTNKYGMITPQPDKDTEYYAGLGVGRYRGDDEYARKILFQNGDYLIPPGKGMGTHCNLISENMREFYGRCYPDIFASHCTESIFSFMCAALKKQWLLLKDIIIEQAVSLDGQSSGFSPLQWQVLGGQTFDHPYIISSIIQRLCTQEGYDIGMGYEEARNLFPHNPNCYDENYYCKNDQLKYFIKDNCFLKQKELDYDKIKYEWI